MNAKKIDRTRTCNQADASKFLSRATKHLDAIDLLSDDDDFLDSAATLAITAAINASDAACCARLGEHSQGQDHKAAVRLLKEIAPHGEAMASDLGRVLAKKNDAQYRQLPLSATDARNIVKWTRRLIEHASQAVDHSN